MRIAVSNVLSQNWQYTTLSIEDDDDRLGTGFLVADTRGHKDEFGIYRTTWEKPETRAYLVTARHVLGGNESAISCTLEYKIRYNAITTNGLEAKSIDFPICNDPRNWAVHPDASVDVAALDVTDLMPQFTDAQMRFCPLSELANPVSLMEIDVDAGDDVFVIGYPLTLRQGRSNLPLIRKGVLATSPRQPLMDGNRPLRGFLIDGAIMPGSSGSPVISNSVHFMGGDLAMTPNRPLALGVVAQEWGRGQLQRYETAIKAGAATPIEGYANLGFAHSASTIIETIAELGHHDPRSFLQVDHDQRWAPQLGIPEWGLDFSGGEVEPISARRIMLRLHRDRMRAAGYSVVYSEFHDAPEIMGPVDNIPSVKQHDPNNDLFLQRGLSQGT